MIDETVEEIREMQTHSSSVVAVKAARALEDLREREFASVEDFERDLERNSSALRRANPSHASLVTTQRAIVSMVEDADAETVADAKDALGDAVEDVVEQVETAKRRAARNAVEFVEDGATILTHDYSSTVLETIEQAVSEGRYLTVYVTEARPRYLGRKTARVLAEMDRVDAHLVVDGASGHFLPECDRVLLGMDCIVGDTLYNRIGTFPLAATADRVDVPVTVVGSSAKLVGEGFRFENDFRSASEVLLEPAEGFSVENPAYDATPTDLLDAVVTDEGVQEF
ncbi:translation initiation factor eIF-2B [Halorussus aquaticus]|uniref:Translation initiation factor eIF-2B n=1 Tax=Halorussus aquaticus TaxID=2953748 RepID=A0ABD5Q4U7_9EURY|nr:translation initiation factor eIF-2B [Halorussus aquaticus]